MQENDTIEDEFTSTTNDGSLTITGLGDDEEGLEPVGDDEDNNTGTMLGAVREDEEEDDDYYKEFSEEYNVPTREDLQEYNNHNVDTENLEENNLVQSNVQHSNTALVSNGNKKLKILVGNGRPGLGKSTTALQLIAPYLFMVGNQQKVPLYTFESLTDNNMFSTHILDAHSIEVRENSFDNALINIFTRDENAIFDIGGGKTTQVVMDSLKNTGLIFGIDLFVIPLTDGKHEALKAKEFYDFIKAHNKGARIVFVLNKVAPNACYDDVCLQYIDFLGDRNLMVDATRGIIEDIAVEDRNLVHLYNDDIIKYAVRHEQSVFEIAFTDTSETDRMLLEAIANNDVNAQKYLSARKMNIAKAKKYYELSIEPSMATFDRLVGRN